MRPLSESTSRIAGKSFERKYVALGRIVKAWAQIVGEELASKAQPVKIRYRKRVRAKQAEASLDIAVSSAEATALHYQKDLILERINQVFGERWITDIRFVHVPAESSLLTPKHRPKPLSPSQKNSVSALLQGIEDMDIKERLETLGHSIISKDLEKT